MADYWDWTDSATDRHRRAQLSLGDAKMRRLEADYDRQVLKAREDLERAHALRGRAPWEPAGPAYFRQLDPEVRMSVMAQETDLLSPRNPAPGYAGFLEEAVRYPAEIGARPRDTLIRAAQEMHAGNYGDALGYAAASPASALVPALSAGRAGDEDDWREVGRRHGVSERDIALLDYGTDPTTYIGLGLARAAPRVLSRADDILRALGRYGSQARYGRGVPTYIEDAVGNTLMRTRNSPGGVLEQLALPAP